MRTSDVFEGYHRERSTLTMSSREIADLTGSTHDNVLKTIRSLVDRGVVSGNETPYIHPQNGQTDVSSIGSIFKDTYGRDQTEYRLDRELTMTLVSGYDIPLRPLAEVSNDGTYPKTMNGLKHG